MDSPYGVGESCAFWLFVAAEEEAVAERNARSDKSKMHFPERFPVRFAQGAREPSAERNGFFVLLTQGSEHRFTLGYLQSCLRH